MNQQNQIRVPGGRKDNRMMLIGGIIIALILIILCVVFYAQKSRALKTANERVSTLEKEVEDLKKTDEREDLDTTDDSSATEETNEEETTTPDEEDSTETVADVSVAPEKKSKTFDVSVGTDKIGTITRDETSNIEKIVARDTHAYIGFNNDGIGGSYYIGADELWQVDPKAKTMEKIEVKGVSAVSLDEKKIAYTSSDGKLHIKFLSGSADKTFSFEGYDIIGDTLFSPESDKIAVQVYNSKAAENTPTGVFMVNITTGSKTMIVEKDTVVHLKQWLSNSEIEYSSKYTNSPSDF